MASDFSRTLALLRREKRISQRTAAGDLQVSQALLSHYENGLREPGLGFVVRAADYYGVSCDYLLGRSMSREGARAHQKTSSEGSEAQQDAFLKLLSDSTALLLELAGKSGSEQLVEELNSYLSVVLYKLFRYLYAADPSSPEEAFKTPAESFEALCEARLRLSELRIRAATQGQERFGLSKESVSMPNMSLAQLAVQYPEQTQSLLEMLQQVSELIEKTGKNV